MSLTHRKPRPLLRDDKTLRDDRLFIVACDDTYAPAQYFNFFKLTRVKVHVVVTTDGSSAAEHVLDRLLTYERKEYDELWMLLDVDHCASGNHVAGFSKALSDAKRQGVKVALSKPCFEIWLLLHHEEDLAVTSALPDCKSTEAALRAKLGEYNKTKLKSDHYPLGSVANACERAEALDSAISGGDIPNANTTRVYQLWKSIAAKALSSQLPPELGGLLPGA